MKKNISLIAFLGSVLFSGVAFGQSTASGSVTLNVELHPIIALEFQGGASGSSTGGVVDLIYKTQDNYTRGVEVNKTNHFKVTSMGGYKIKAKSTDLTHRGGGTNTIPAGSIKLKVSGGNETALQPNNFVELFKENSAVTGKSFDVLYKGAGNNEYKTKYVSNENPSIYTTQVVYSVEAI